MRAARRSVEGSKIPWTLTVVDENANYEEARQDEEQVDAGSAED
jgi:hypothetical protein